MNLHLETTSERGKAVTKTGNEEMHLILRDKHHAVIMEMVLVVEKDNVIVKDFWAGDMNTQEIKNYYKKFHSPKIKVCQNKDTNGNACYDCESGQGYGICGDNKEDKRNNGLCVACNGKNPEGCTYC